MTEYHNQPAAFIIDDIIKGIVNSGHPKARRLAEDYNEAREQLTADPNMTMGAATVEALVQILEQAYSLYSQPSLAMTLSLAPGEGLLEEEAEAVLAVADDIRAGEVTIIKQDP